MKKNMIIDGKELEMKTRELVRRDALKGINLKTRVIGNKKHKAVNNPKYKPYE